VQALAKKGVGFHVALGVGAHLEAWGIRAEQIHEHEWWEGSALPGGVTIVSTPARHFSGRHFTDTDRTLWTSWAMVGPRHRVFFSGDTGLTTAFAEVREKHGPFDVALLEIGQWHPSWGSIHLGPKGALEAHALLGAKHLLPIHWATFELGLHPWNEPPETLVTEGARSGVSVVTPRLGEPIEPLAGERGSPWWRALPPIAATCPQG
jgi:L-ascorbate metabolism protein UlaG (beta-lactamase superfamily)